MKNNYLFLLLTTMFFSFGYSQNNLWTKINRSEVSSNEIMHRSSSPKDYTLLNLDLEQLIKLLKDAPLYKENVNTKIIIPFPTLSGEIENFEVYTAPVMDIELFKKFPNIQSYLGIGVDNPNSSIRFSITSFGLNLINFSNDKEAVYIDPYSSNLKNYIVYKKSDLSPKNNYTCEVYDDEINLSERKFKNATYQTQNNTNFFREYRLALTCTPEYASYHIEKAKKNQISVNTDEKKKAVVLSAMVVTITRVNSIYERDLGIRFNLIANNEKLIHLKHDSNFNDKINSESNALLVLNQKITDNIIGNSNYDIGHIFCTGGGGVARLNSICSNFYKAMGVTGSPNPTGDPFDVDYVTHEMGHQLGADHTFNKGCVDKQISDITSMEPGSGTSIMGYAGVCESINWNNIIKKNSDPYFHSVSISQILGKLSYTYCSTNTPFKNPAPVVDAGEDKVIPKGTPFKLTGSAIDSINQENLTYSWEQADTYHSQQPPVSSSTEGPLFRIFPPKTTPTRYFPHIGYVLQGKNNKWEVLPTVARDLNFWLLVRNNDKINGGQTAIDNIKIKVADTGPFTITYPNDADIEWEPNSSQTITWDVAGTTDNGINTSHVRILISTNNAENFTELLNNTPNDGSETIIVPDTISANCRIMIEPVDNVYYAISKNFKIDKAKASIDKVGLTNFNLSPNPTDDIFSVNFESNSNNDIKISVHDLNGKLILSQTYQNTGRFSQKISLSSAQSGVYLVTIEDGKNKEVKKVIKK